METSSLCAKIPVELHRKVREKQVESGVGLGEYMADLLEKYYKTMEENPMIEKNRTIAFQVSDEDYYRVKAHLKRTGKRQNEFMYHAIFDVVAEAEHEIPSEALQDQLLDAEISGEKKPRNRSRAYENQQEHSENYGEDEE